MSEETFTWPGWTRDVLQQPVPLDKPIQLDEYGIRFVNDNSRSPFYPFKLLEHIFTEQVLSTEIDALELGENVETRALVREVLGSDCSQSKTYIQIFATLKLIGKPHLIKVFVEKQISDQELPISNNGSHYQLSKGRIIIPSIVLSSTALRLFRSEQYNTLVHFFNRRTGDLKGPQELKHAVVLPYYEISPGQASAGHDQVHGIYGSSATVSKILIHPLCHEFDDIFESLKDPDEDMYFALKKFAGFKPEEFKDEVTVLDRYNGTRHPHLVTMVAAFSFNHTNYLIFPWATHDLGMYWQTVRPTPDASDPGLVRWISYQAWMLVDAIRCMHVPEENTNIPENDRIVGRHGDIKSENILWYKSGGEFGKLVIADMGISKTHRWESKTYTRKGETKRTPRYQPPELDFSKGRLGRTFDIWTLGCVFFEFLTWLYKGYAGLEKSKTRMTVPSIRGPESDEYFEWVYVKDRDYYSVRVKQAVTRDINILRKNCSQFVYDFLDIIENELLVVERNDRISALELVIKMEKLHERCNNSREYCVQKAKRKPRAAQKPNLQARTFHESLALVGKDKVPKVRAGSFIPVSTNYNIS
ncbi:kinase-like domain-containing protein [Nemania sp. NC0429]|nr:kinase-like domain-containing protein [Nemania sp. NC0429]